MDEQHENFELHSGTAQFEVPFCYPYTRYLEQI